MKNQMFCKNCGMMLITDNDLGINADGSKNSDYCIYCYKGGELIAECSMEEVLDFCSEHVYSWELKATIDETIEMIKERLNKLHSR